MRNKLGNKGRLALCVALALAAEGAAAQACTWTTIASMGDNVPGSTTKFNSFNQPAINHNGLVVFRARSKASSETSPPYSGVFLRDMALLGPITPIASRGGEVPAPNNTLYTDLYASFNEFPSTPRIDALSGLVATRGQSQPVYTYLAADGVTETRVGTSGVYVLYGGELVTGASLLGAVLEKTPTGTFELTFPHFSVPGATPGTRFDQFPGSPGVTNGSVITFKGNYTDPADGIGRTGVFFRDLAAVGAPAPIRLVANSTMTIPNQPAGGTTLFGSTAPPSAANGHMIFTGLDNEDAPTLGGIYRAPLADTPPLQVLAGIGDQVPGEPEGATFNRIGEGLSVSGDGRYVSFWAAWGTASVPKTLYCPPDGEKSRIEYCNATHPSGYATSIPANQGIFVADAVTGRVTPVAKAGQDGIADFIYWVFSGAPPVLPGSGSSGGDSDGDSKEPPRWRSSAFSALAGKGGEFYGTPQAPSPYQVAFKANRNGVDGIYLRKGGIGAPLATVAEVAITRGESIDAGAPAGSVVTSLGVERDGFRHDKLAITSSMLYETVETSIGWAGIYLANVPALLPGKLVAETKSVDFGSVPVGGKSDPLDVKVANTGELAVDMQSMAANAAPFAVAGHTCPAKLAAGDFCAVSVTFAPTLFGPHTAQLGINGSAVTVALAGSGVFGPALQHNITATVSEYYARLFSRAPDAEGLAYWSAEVERMRGLGVDTKEVFYAMGRAMLSSPEYLARNTSNEQFIADLYAAFLMRAPDAEGLAFWLGQIAKGLDRRVIVNTFMFSAEYTGVMGSIFGTANVSRPEFNAVVDLYRGFLNRIPDSGGFAWWLKDWQVAQCGGNAAVVAVAEKMSAQFLESPEFAARIAAEPAATRSAMMIAAFYDAFMRRGADADGFLYWVGQLESGRMSLHEVRQAFVASPEFQSRITAICSAGCILK